MDAWLSVFHDRSTDDIQALSSSADKRETRKKTMIKPIRNLARVLRGPSRAEREFAYLSESQDLVDLEHRQRQIDRGLFSGR